MEEIIIYTDNRDILKEKDVLLLQTKFIFLDIETIKDQRAGILCRKQCIDDVYRPDNISSLNKILAKVREDTFKGNDIRCLLIYSTSEELLLKEATADIKNAVDKHRKTSIGIIYAIRIYYTNN